MAERQSDESSDGGLQTIDNFENALCNRINDRIKTRGYCVVYDHELSRICPPESALRKKQLRAIEEFAARNGLEVCIREIGINATFKRKQRG